VQVAGGPGPPGDAERQVRLLAVLGTVEMLRMDQWSAPGRALRGLPLDGLPTL